MPDVNQQLQEMQQTIDQLKETVEKLVNHNHLGVDGSMEYQGETQFKGKSLTVAGGITTGNNRLVLPIVIADGTTQKWLSPDGTQRKAAFGLAIVGTKGTASEQDNNMVAVTKPGSAFSEDLSIPPNQIDWEDSAEAFMRLVMLAQGVAAFSGPSVFGPLGFWVGERTPFISGSTGSLTQGGSTVTDSSAAFAADSLVGCLLSLVDSAGTVLESYIVLTNTSNVITVGHYQANGAAVPATFALETGTYTYSIRNPILLGESGMPYGRVYVGEDVRLGYGNSGGTQVRYIKWGFGSPEGVVTANPGSLYLNFDGGSLTTFWVKESGVQSPFGWVGK